MRRIPFLDGVPTSFVRTLALVVAACAIVVGMTWGIALERIRYEQSDALADAVRQNTNLVLAFEEQALRAVKAADQALLYMKREYERDHAVIDLNALFPTELFGDLMIRAEIVTNEHGDVLDGRGAATRINVADRDFFAYHRQHDEGALWISAPLRGRIVNRTMISLSRRISRADGSFGGVAAVGIDPNYFLNTYKRFDLGPGGLVQLVGLDGIARARRQGERESFGQDMSGSQLLALARANASGTFTTRGNSDGLQRVESYRVVKGYPLVVAVGRSLHAVFARSEARARYYLLGAMGATFAVLAAGFLFGLMLERQRRADERYRITFDQASIGVVHLALDGRFMRVNRKYCEMLGYSESELLTRTSEDVTHPEDRTVLADGKRVLSASRQATVVPEFEKRNIRQDGSIIWVRVAANLVRTPAGRPMYLVAVVQDVTARKLAEAQILKSEARNRAVFDQAAVGVSETALDGRFLRANRKLCEMVGYSESELKDLTFTALTHHDDQAKSTALARELLANGNGTFAPAIEKRYVRKDRTVVWAMVSVAAVRGEDGTPGHFLTMMQDITARKVAEAQLLEQLDELRRFQRVTVGRELRMMELEDEIRGLRHTVSQ